MSEQIRFEFDVPCVMRDDTVLRANVLRPACNGTYPVLVTRTPYGKDLSTVSVLLDPIRAARAGYIAVIQDVRGRFRSEGEWSPLRHEAQDGYDTVEWAAGLPDSSGNVGMYGGSYMGFTQWAAALQAPPHLKAIVPSVTWADVCDGLTWRGGAFELGKRARWELRNRALDLILRRLKSTPRARKRQAVGVLVDEIDRLRTEGYFSLPLREFAPFVKAGISCRVFREPYSREYNAPFSVASSYDKVRVPAYNIGGWYDIFTQGTLDNFRALATRGSTPEVRQSRVLIGPWAHTCYANAVGEMDFGVAASAALIDIQADLTRVTLRWFDYWLKGIDNGITREPPVKIFVMGDNIWRDEREWPLARTQYTAFYLHGSGRASSLPSDGILSTHEPGDEPADHYIYDPADPTPTYGGALLMNPLFGIGVRDQRPVEQRQDVLVYTSEPLSQDTEVTGPVVVRLWAASDARDTDFVARLVDVHPDGLARNLCDGIIRARYREGESPKLLEPGKAYQFVIDLWSTANVFKAGHRIRLDIASASFPRWDRNPNTGSPFGSDASIRPAHQTVLHDAAHPSHVLLPIIPH